MMEIIKVEYVSRGSLRSAAVEIVAMVDGDEWLQSVDLGLAETHKNFPDTTGMSEYDKIATEICFVVQLAVLEMRLMAQDEQTTAK